MAVKRAGAARNEKAAVKRPSALVAGSGFAPETLAYEASVLLLYHPAADARESIVKLAGNIHAARCFRNTFADICMSTPKPLLQSSHADP